MGSELRTSGTSAAPKTKKTKAVWSNDIHETFVDLCLEETLKGNKPSTFFNKEGWKNIEDAFHKKLGLRYERKQLKNHWDVTKEQWKSWSKLISTSSMGWDANTRTFAATEEDWADYIQANPEAAQFRFRELMLADKLSIIFNGRTNSGEAQTQAMARPAQRRRVSDSSATTTPILPRKEIAEATTADCRADQFNDAVESRSMVTAQSSLGKLSYSIGECIECLDGMVEIEQGSDLYLFALDIFLKKEYREVFLQLKRSSVRMAWLQRMQSVGPPLPLH